MITNGLVFEWKGGTKDWSRNKHTIVNNNCVPVRGVKGDAMKFNGTTSYLNCGNDASLNITDAITIEAWVKRGDTGRKQRVIYKRIGASTGYILSFQNNDTITWELGNGASWCAPTVSGTYTSITQWYHIVALVSPDDTKVYMNGIEKGATGSKCEIASTVANSLFIGSTTGITELFNGTISSVRIYNRALSPLEIWNNYQVMKPYIPLSESPVAIV